MKFHELTISGCFETVSPAHHDSRGVFTKSVQAAELNTHGLESDFKETFYTISGPNVLRGMHLQLPPADHAKLVYCVAGRVLDVILDVRHGSPTYGKFECIELSEDQRNGLYLSRGVAHGFCVLHAPAIMMYHVTSEHVPGLDAGIAWNSFGAPWPLLDPIVSSRDAALPGWDQFNSPFVLTEPVEALHS